MPEPQKPNPVGWPRISSSLYYEDPHRAIEWLCNGFGFQLRLKVEGEAGEVVHSELTYGDGVIMVSSRRRDPEKGSQTCNPNIRHPGAVGGANTQNLMVYVDDLEAHHARAVQHGAKVTSPIALHDYGEEHWADRSYGAMDPDGHHWWFCERMRDPGEAGEVSALDRTIAALADPTRRGVVDLLRRRPRRAGELASALAMSAPAMSRHLRVLRESGLIEDDGPGEDARVRTFRLRQKPFLALRDWIAEVESFWTSQLDAFKAHAERARPGKAR